MFATSSFRPVMRGTYQLRRTYDRFGQSGFSDPIGFGLSVVKMDVSIQPTSIRTDKSGSKSYAEEDIIVGRILSNTDIPKGSIVTTMSQMFKVIAVFPRYDMDGRINHWQIDLSLWR